MSPSLAQSEASLIFNRASVALAKSQRLIASWLPPPSSTSIKTVEEIEQEEAEIFKPIPELLGLGASLAPETDLKRQKASTDETLRRQMLGRDYQRRQNVRLPNLAQNARPRTTTTNRYATNTNVNVAKETEGDDDDAEGGRSSLGKRLRNNDNDDGGGGGDAKGVERLEARKKRAVIYLDEVLSAKSQKQRKKKMKKEGKMAVS